MAIQLTIYEHVQQWLATNHPHIYIEELAEPIGNRWTRTGSLNGDILATIRPKYPPGMTADEEHHEYWHNRITFKITATTVQLGINQYELTDPDSLPSIIRYIDCQIASAWRQ